MKFPRRGWMAALGVVVAGVVAACGDTTTGISEPNLLADAAGGWTLQSINGQALPFVMRNDASGQVTLLGGSLTIAEPYFSQFLDFQNQSGGGQPAAMQSNTQGQVSVVGSRIRFRASGGGEFEGVLAGPALEYTIQGNNGPLVFRFRRQ